MAEVDLPEGEAGMVEWDGTAEGAEASAVEDCVSPTTTGKPSAWDALQLPAAIVSRTVKSVLQSQSATVRVEKAALESLSRCASLSLLYIADAAASLAAQAKRKTITASDVFAALDSLQLSEVAAQVTTACQAAARTSRSSSKGESDSPRCTDTAELEGTSVLNWESPAQPCAVSDTEDMTTEEACRVDTSISERPMEMEEDQPPDTIQVQVDALTSLLEEETEKLPFQL